MFITYGSARANNSRGHHCIFGLQYRVYCLCVGAVYYKQICKSEQRPPLQLRTADLVPQPQVFTPSFSIFAGLRDFPHPRGLLTESCCRVFMTAPFGGKTSSRPPKKGLSRAWRESGGESGLPRPAVITASSRLEPCQSVSLPGLSRIGAA